VCTLCALLIGNALSVIAQVLCIMRSGAIEVCKGTGGILLHLEEEQALRRLYHPAREDRKEKGHPSTWTSVSGAKNRNSENGLELYTILGSPLVPFPHLHLLLRVKSMPIKLGGCGKRHCLTNPPMQGIIYIWQHT
jgi:hypothetical protein